MSYDQRPWLKSYAPGIAKEISPPEITFIEHLKKVVERASDVTALHYLGEKFTHREVDELTNRLAWALKDRGLGKGDVVGVCMPNMPQYVLSVIGALKAGCAVSGVSPLLSGDEMVYQLNDCGAKALIIMDVLYDQTFYGIAGKVPGLKTVVSTGLVDYLPKIKQFLAKKIKKIPTGQVKPIPGKEILSFRPLLARHSQAAPNVDVSMDDDCFIQYTGGTTGVPKGAVLTHRNLISNMTQFGSVLPLESGKDAFCSGLPMFHIAGLVVSMLGFYFGISQILVPDPRNTQMIVKELIKHKPTVTVNVPTLYLMLVKEPDANKVDWSRLRVCFSGAAPFNDEGIAALEKVVGKGKVKELYGMTETSPLIAMDHPDSPKKVGSVGLPFPSTGIRLVDPLNGNGDVPLGQEGEILVKGPQVMKGYHNKQEETSKTFADYDGELWLRTGDIGRMDEDGYLYIVDRSKDMIIVGGYKVFSTEVENKLAEHPAVEMCAIVGAPNPQRPETEIVKLVVQKSIVYADRPDDEIRADILAYAREKLASYKVPKVVEFMEMPLTAVGKIDKKVLR